MNLMIPIFPAGANLPFRTSGDSRDLVVSGIPNDTSSFPLNHLRIFPETRQPVFADS